MIKRKRIQYNEITEETYAPKYWTTPRLVIIGVVLLFFGFLVNFSLEERINRYLQTTLGQNPSCPIQFEKADLSYFLPKIVLRRPVILGLCFGQMNNRLEFKDIKIGFHSPSFYPVGLRFHIEALSGKSKINLYPVISLFSQNVRVDNTSIDTKLFAAMTETNLSPVSGVLSIEGFFEFKSGKINGGELDIVSRNFTLPSQNIKGFELTELKLDTLNIAAHFIDPDNLSVDRIQIGKSNSPVEVNLKGQVKVNHNDFMGSPMNLSGNLFQEILYLRLF
ncbi:MAG: hypothetical protein K2Q18_08050 [Bdellovibrionales bacterium]|nr:hypothetical protein [Bdellovibrionales bacterium]